MQYFKNMLKRNHQNHQNLDLCCKIHHKHMTHSLIPNLSYVFPVTTKSHNSNCITWKRDRNFNYSFERIIGTKSKKSHFTPGADTCHIQYRSLGCYHDDQVNPRPLPELILTERDPSHRSWNGRMVDWANWNSYHVEFICRCAAKARELKYRFFSTQFYGKKRRMQCHYWLRESSDFPRFFPISLPHFPILCKLDNLTL